MIKYIIIFMLLYLTFILSRLLSSIRERNRIKSMRNTLSMLSETISSLIDFFMQEKGVHDALVNNLDLNTEEYFMIYKEAFAYIVKNIPRKLQRESLVFMTKDQYFDFISREIYRHLNMIYNVIR